MLSKNGKFEEALEFHTNDKHVCTMMQAKGLLLVT